MSIINYNPGENNNGISTITLAKPQSLSIRGKQELLLAIRKVAEDPESRVLIIAQGHPQAFQVDVSELADMLPSEAAEYSHAGQAIALALAALPFPAIAAVDGIAVGGGCELAMSCDLTYASAVSQFGQIEANGGVIPAFGGTWNLSQRVGLQKASELIFTGSVFSAKQAKEWGLVLEVLEADQLIPYVHEVATKIVKAARMSVANSKRVLREGYGLSFSTALAMEQGSFASLFGTADQRIRMHAFLDEQHKEDPAPAEKETAVLTIRKEKPEFTFINVWNTADQNKQQQLLEAMKADAPEIQRQQGFVGMAFQPSSDGRQVVVYAQWESEEDFTKGIVQNPKMTAGRNKLAKFGTPSPNTYATDGIFLPLGDGNQSEQEIQPQ
jgi:enoyl-CoA hydratase